MLPTFLFWCNIMEDKYFTRQESYWIKRFSPYAYDLASVHVCTLSQPLVIVLLTHNVCMRNKAIAHLKFTVRTGCVFATRKKHFIGKCQVCC